MTKFLSAFFLLAGLTIALPQAAAQSEPATPKKTATKKKTTKKKKAVAKKEEPATEKEDEKVDTSGLSSTHYSCDMGHKLTIHSQSKDDKQITVSWRNRLHKLFRVSTTTGADRFEGPKSGLVWVGIPSKGMLLDAHKGQPLANDCMSASQLRHST